MSYDLTGMRLAPGETVEAAIERLEESAEDDHGPDERAWGRIVGIAAALEGLDPTAERYENRDDGVVELTSESLQVSVFEDQAAIAIPWSLDGGAVSDLVTPYIEVLQRVGGFVIYDPQASCVVDENDHGNAIASAYQSSDHTVRAAMRRYLAASPRRWWPFGRG